MIEDAGPGVKIEQVQSLLKVQQKLPMMEGS
jgi:hypothetical protein